MIFGNDKISARQFQIMLILDIFSTSIIVLPRCLAVYAEQDAWITVVFATLIVATLVFIMMSCSVNCPNDTYYGLIRRVFGKFIGTIIVLGFIVKTMAFVSYELSFFGDIVGEIMLPRTSFTAVCASMLVVCGFCAVQGIEVRARLYEILVVLVFLFIIVVMGVVSTESDFSNILPIMTTTPKYLGYGTLRALMAFSGIEYCMLMYPYISNKQNVRRKAVNTTVLLGIMMTIVTIVATARFSHITLKRQLWPVLEMINAVDLPGTFIERQDAFVLSFWIVGVFSTITAGLYFSTVLMMDIIKVGKHHVYVAVFGIIIFVNCLGINKFNNDIRSILTIIYILTFVYICIVPIALFVGVNLKKLGRDKNEN